MKKKFAMIIMGNEYNPNEHKAKFETTSQITYICTINNWNMLKETIEYLQKEGVGAIELCGAFGKERAQEIVEMTNSEIAVGYVVHEPKLDPLFNKFFGN